MDGRRGAKEAPMISLPDLIGAGGVFFNIAGSSPEEALTALLGSVRLPNGVDREALLTAVLEREELMPTAVGHGIAIPHPRSPMVPTEGEDRIIVAYPRTPLPYRALDKQPVYALFLILSSSQKSHLQILAQLSFLFHDAAFRKALEKKPAKEELAEEIKKALLS